MIDALRSRWIPGLLAVLSLSACVSPPRGVEPISGFELERYLGTWYEIARLDHRFERGLSNVTATYERAEDGGVRVINRGYNAGDGEWSTAEGSAYFTGESDVGSLKVSFFGPFYGGYHVIALDREDYQWAMVAGPNRDYLWILAREPEMDEAVYERLVGQARELGFAVEELIRVEHGEVVGVGG